jgi:uncharacterized membrane protein YhaH (DUF805 family)
MGPGSALLLTIRRTFQFSGYAGRAEFWWSWVIFYFFATILLLYRGLSVTTPREDAFLTIALCIVAIPMISVGTRRMADAGIWRWFFLLAFALNWATQLAYMIAMPTASQFWMMTFQAERNDVELLLSGPELRTLLYTIRDDLLPWSAKVAAIGCLILALLPSRSIRQLQPVRPSPEVIS